MKSHFAAPSQAAVMSEQMSKGKRLHLSKGATGEGLKGEQI